MWEAKVTSSSHTAGADTPLPLLAQNSLYTVNLSGMQPNVNDIERPPPDIKLPANACITNHPKANADPSYQRCTLNAVPSTASLLSKSKLPFGIVLSPYRSVRPEDGDEPVPVVTDSVIARCRRCRTYINPYVQFIEGGQRWKCKYEAHNSCLMGRRCSSPPFLAPRRFRLHVQHH